MLLALKKAASVLLLPPLSCMALVLLGWLLYWRGARGVGAVLMWVGSVTLVLLSMPAVASLLNWMVYDGSRFDPVHTGAEQAIVILGGGLRFLPEYGGDTLGRLSLERVRYGARVARATGLPVLVTGGRLSTTTSEAEVMREAVESEFGVPVRWVEPCSQNTYENARFSAEILRRDGVSRIVLVTHGVDARRARREFSAAGLVVTVAPTAVPAWGLHSPLDLLPSAQALSESALAIYELAANMALTLGLNKSGAGAADCARGGRGAVSPPPPLLRIGSTFTTRPASRPIRTA